MNPHGWYGNVNADDLSAAEKFITLFHRFVVWTEWPLMTGCLGIFFRLLAEALAVRVAQEIVKRLTGGFLRKLLAALLALIGIRI